MCHIIRMKRQLYKLHQCLLLVHIQIANGFSDKNWEGHKLRLLTVGQGGTGISHFCVTYT